MSELISPLAQYGALGILSGILVFFLIKIDKNHREDRKEAMLMVQKQYEKMNENQESHHKLLKEMDERRHKETLDLTEVLSDIKHLIRQ